MIAKKRRLPLSVLFLTFVALGAARADDQARDLFEGLDRFIRVQNKDEDSRKAVQVSVRRCVVDPSRTFKTPGFQPRRDLPSIDLVSIIHVAEVGYFKDINERLQGYDLVLYESMGYELFKPLDLPARPQRQLVHQSVALSQSKSWRLADMTYKKQLEVLGAPGAMGLAALRQQVVTLPSLGRSFWLTNLKDMRPNLKQLPKEFLILQRNSLAFAEIIRAAYQGHKRVAVVYGAAHMPDLERRLVDELGYKCAETTWLTAIHDREEEPKPAKRPRLY